MGIRRSDSRPKRRGPWSSASGCDHPDPGFPISLRTGWDPQGMDPGRIRDELAAFTEAGIQHVVSAPWRRDLDDWLRSMDQLAELVL